MNKRKILIILENKPGALARVVGLFHQRGYNIASLHVDAVEDVSLTVVDIVISETSLGFRFIERLFSSQEYCDTSSTAST